MKATRSIIRYQKRRKLFKGGYVIVIQKYIRINYSYTVNSMRTHYFEIFHRYRYELSEQCNITSN